MADGNGSVDFIGQFLQCDLPQSGTADGLFHIIVWAACPTLGDGSCGIALVRSMFTMESSSLLDKLSAFLDARHRRQVENKKYEELATAIQELSARLDTQYPRELQVPTGEPPREHSDG